MGAGTHRAGGLMDRLAIRLLVPPSDQEIQPLAPDHSSRWRFAMRGLYKLRHWWTMISLHSVFPGMLDPRAQEGVAVVGLDLSVGYIADLRENDPEGTEVFEEQFAFVNLLLQESGLAPHTEPLKCEVWGCQMFGYSGLHYLRRIAAHVDAGLPVPHPGGDDSSNDSVLLAYYDDVAGKTPSLVNRIFRKQARFSRTFDHLIVHSDAEGFYLPQDFPQVLFAEDKKLPGGMLGSVPRLLAELERLAVVLGVPGDLHSQSEELWEAADSQGEGDENWQRYGIESYSCVVLREACHKSLESGAAIVFC